MADNELEQQEEKDVHMEDEAGVDEDELLGTKERSTNEQDESMKETDGDAEVKDGAAGDEQKKEEELKKEEEDLDDGGAASDLEFSIEDERAGIVEETPSWTWHLEVYPIAPEDTQLDNFCKMIQTAVQSHVVYRSNELGEKRGEAHFYTNEAAAAKTLMRTICCRKFACIRPYIYLYRKKEGESEEYETAALRLDLIEAAKMRWDRQRKKQGEASSRVAKVSNVPLGTSQEFLNVLFARAFRVKRESAESEAEEARKAQEAAENAEKEAESSTSAEKKDEKEEDEDKEENEEEEEEELVGEFNGTVTIDCCSRTSLKGFLLGYRKIIIGENLLTIQPLAPEEFDIDAIRREVRKKRAYEIKHGKEWTPVTPADKVAFKEDENKAGGSQRGGYGGGGFGGRGGYGRGGDRGDRGRGGRGDGRGGRGGRGGVMTGRQKMNEKSMRRGGGRGGGGGSFRDEMRYLQRDLALSTFELQRQLATLRGRDRGYGGGYGDPYLDPYLEPLGGRYGGGGYRRDDWGGGYGGGRGGRGGGGGGGGNKRPYRGKR